MTKVFLWSIILLKGIIVIMEEILTDFEIELNEARNLVMVLDNAVTYCTENRIDADHIYTFSNYVSERMDLLCQNFEGICNEYYNKHVSK